MGIGWRRFGMVTVALLLGVGIGLACNPEPGWQHFLPPPPGKVELAPPPAPMFPVGYFEVHNTLNGLPCDRIRCILPVGEDVLVGTEGGGLMLFRDGNWRSFTPDSEPAFPAPTVTALLPGSGEGTVIAATIAGLVEISGLPAKLVFTPRPLTNAKDNDFLALGRLGSRLAVGTSNGAGWVEPWNFLPMSFQESRFPTGFSCLAGHQGSLWLGSSEGLFQALETLLQPRSYPGIEFGWVQGLLSIKEDLYIASAKGLYGLNGDSCREIVPGIWFTALAATPGTRDFFSANSFKSMELSGGGTLFTQGFDRSLQEKTFDKVKTDYEKAEKALEGEFNTVVQEHQKLVSKALAAGRPPEQVDLLAYTQRLANLEAKQKSLANKFQALVKTPPVPVCPLMKGLWAGTQEQGVILFATDGKSRHLTSENSKLPSNRVSAAAAKESGEAWIGTADAGILRYRTYMLAAKPALNQIWEGEAGFLGVAGENLLVGTKKEGLLIFDTKTNEKKAHHREEAIPGFPLQVTGADLDRHARLWVGGDRGVWVQGEQGWKGFGLKEGLPDPFVTCLEIDGMERVFVTCGKSCPISEQLAVYNGVGFTSFGAATLKYALGLPGASGAAYLDLLGVNGYFQRSINLASTPAQILARYDDGASESGTTALLGIPQYLLMGTAGGNQIMFDGEGFKHLSNQATGHLRRVVAMAQRRNGDLVVVGEKRVLIFDGQRYLPVLPVTPSVDRYTGLALDGKNPELFWVSYVNSDGKGGVALYEAPLWKPVPLPFGPEAIAVADPFIFVAEKCGVWRMMP